MELLQAAERAPAARTRPPPLPRGGTIAVVSPASPVETPSLDAAQSWLEQLGYRVRFSAL